VKLISIIVILLTNIIVDFVIFGLHSLNSNILFPQVSKLLSDVKEEWVNLSLESDGKTQVEKGCADLATSIVNSSGGKIKSSVGCI
jgi:hypothetical protein